MDRAEIWERAPLVRRLLAPNPSPMTERGTNTYLLGRNAVAVIDPGPDDPVHLAAIQAEIGPEAQVTHILVTHAHRDHSALAPRLSEEVGAPVCAFGRATEGRTPTMETLAARGLAGGGEGLDLDFVPDRRLADGEVLESAEWQIGCLWTPGHIGNHLTFVLGDLGFSGDHVMGWASSLVSPPDGDIAQFRESCRRLADLGLRRLLPGHGAAVEDPAARIAWLLAHRESRERQILEALDREGARTVPALAAAIYTETPSALLPAAERNVFAHLVDLVGRDLVRASPELAPDATFGLA